MSLSQPCGTVAIALAPGFHAPSLSAVLALCLFAAAVPGWAQVAPSPANAVPGPRSAASSPDMSVKSTPLPTSVPGVTQAMRDVKLAMTVAGRIEAVAVREGDQVRRGQVLLHLDRALEDLEVRRRRVLLDDNSRLLELREKEKTLQSQVQSLRPLLESGAVSRKQLEDEELALGAVVAERNALEAAKKREQVELDLAIESYERRHLRSPIHGVVSKILLRLGESVGPSEPVVHVVDVSRVRFMGTLPSQAGSRLKVGQSVTIKLGTDMLTRQARVVFVSPVTDAASGLIEVIAEFDNSDGSVRPGISGRLQF